MIVVDPGHNGANGAHPAQINKPVDAGGFDKPCNTAGAANSRQDEADFTWSLAQVLRADLQAAGAVVVLTRESNDGWGPCVDARGKLAGQVGARALVSLHADGAASSGHGFHVIYTDQASVPLASALRDDLRGQGLQTSTYLGQDGLDHRDDLGTLNWAKVPAVMLEAGNMANRADADLLASADGQARIADAITAALTTQFGHP